MVKPPPLPSGEELVPDLSPPKTLRIITGVFSFGAFAVGLFFFFGAFSSGNPGAIAFGVMGVVAVGLALVVWFGTGIVYRKLAREFHEAGGDWQEASQAILEVQAHPAEPRARELAEWAAANGHTYYGIRSLPVMRRLFYALHFGMMQQRIMKQYQRVVPDSHPHKYKNWHVVTPQRERHWQRYFSEHPEFQAFAGGRFHAPWAGLVWMGAMAGTVIRVVRGMVGECRLLVYDERVLMGEDDDESYIDRTRVLVSSPHPLQVLTIAPEPRDSRTDIDFESVEFNEKFRVDAEDNRFAFDVITPRMMEHLLQSPRFYIEFDAQYVIAHDGDRWLSPEEIGEAGELLRGLAELLPAYLGDEDT